MKYKIRIEERLAKEVEIEANDLDEACEIAQKKYYNEEIVLYSDDFYYREMSVNDSEMFAF